MKKRLISLICIPLLFSLGGCGAKPHTHTYSNEWSYNETIHYHKATCEHTDLKIDEANHSGGEATYEHGKICEVCGYEYTAPLQEDKTLFDKTFVYNGKTSDFKYDKGTSDSEFLSILPLFYSSITDVKLEVANILSSYRISKENYKSLYVNQTKFESKETEQVRTFNDKEVKIYSVNSKNEYELCKFGLDPVESDLYHFYLDIEEEPGKVEIFKLVDREFLSGHNQKAKIFDNGFKLINNELVITFEINLSYDGITYKASFDFYLDKESKSEVKITKQPSDLTIIAPEGFMFEVEVDHPELVIGYQWYAGSFDVEGKPSSLAPLDGTKAKLPKYEVPGTGSQTALYSFACLITTTETQFFSDVAWLYIQSADDEIPAFMVLDYAIRPGNSLDLSNTPYGTGLISYSQDGKEITFNNVDFNNSNIDSSFTNICFEMTSWHNTVEEIEFKFIGNNYVNNTYWEDDHNQGGFGLFMHYAGSSIIPTVTFSGGNLTIVGGTRAISIAGHVVIKNSINCVGLPYRLTHGIYAYDIVVDSGASVIGTIGGSLLYTTHDQSNIWGNITINSGARVSATINPGHVSVGETQLFGIIALNELIINEAEVELTITPDYEYFMNYGYGLAPIIGLYCESYLIKITNSVVNIDITCINTPEENVQNIVLCAQGISSPNVQILDNSKVNINVDSSAFSQVCGVYGIVVNFFDSEVNIRAHGLFYVNGVNAVLKRNNTKAPEDFISILNINEGKIDIYAEADYEILDPITGKHTYLDAAVKAKDYKLALTGDSYIEIESKNMAVMVLCYDHITNELEPYSGYESIYLDQVINKFEISETYFVNQLSYASYSEHEEPKNFFVACESLFSDANGENYLTHIKLTAKE